MMDDVYEGSTDFRTDEIYELFSKRRIRDVDQEKTIELVERAKGSRTMKAFADEMGVHPSVLSRVMSRQTRELSLPLISKIAVYADPSSGVTLEDLMVAQGFGKVSNTKSLTQEFKEACRRTLPYELLIRGYSIEKCIVDNHGPRLDFSLLTNALSDSPDASEQWAFKFLTDGNRLASLASVNIMIYKIMALYYMGYPAKRISIVTDSAAIMNHAKNLLDSTTVPDEISIILIAPDEMKILGEYIAPLRDGRQAKPVFALPNSSKKEKS